MSFSVPIDIGGVTIGYFGLRGGCYADHPDRAVTLQLEVGSAAARTRIPLVRLDWRPLQETHKNQDEAFLHTPVASSEVLTFIRLS